MDGYVTIGTELDSSMIDKQIALLEEKLEGLLEEYEALEKAKPFEGKSKELIKLGAEIDSTRKKLTKLTSQSIPIQDIFNNMGQSITKMTTKIGKWALAVFGIRSAYLAVRKSMSVLSQYNEQIKTDVSYISFAIASALQPIIERLIQLAYQLLVYINQLFEGFFGINLFANATADAFKKANTNANKLRKTLAGFDEMNILGDNTGVAGKISPSVDLSKDQEKPSWMQWLIDNKNEVMSAIFGIQGALISLKLLGLDPLEASGVFLLVFSIINIINHLMEVFDKLDASLENNGTSFKDWGQIISDVGLLIVGLGILIFGLPGIITGVVITIVGFLMAKWNEIQKWFEDRIQEGKDIFSNYWQWILDKVNGAGNEIIQGLWLFIGTIFDIFLLIPDIIYGVVQTVLNLFKDLFNGIKQIFDGILLIFKGDFKNGFISIGKGIVNALISVLNAALGVIGSIWNAILSGIERAGSLFGQNWNLGGAKLTWRIPYLKKGGIINYPGQGVPVGQARGGEAGAEGVIPLTDAQQMALLGESIGKYITINATILNSMNGRIIGRELQRIQNESEFASNG